MYDGGERAIESSEAVAAAQHARAISAISAELALPGAQDCADCGEAIPDARRNALPSARRCVDCQQSFESEGR